MSINLDYFKKINNAYSSSSKNETDLFVMNRHFDRNFDGSVAHRHVLKNGKPYEVLILRDTEKQTKSKRIRTKNSTPFTLGDYIEWDNQMWLVTRVDTDKKAHISGLMTLCEYQLSWQNRLGNIVQRWCTTDDFTRYASGVSGNRNIQVGDKQFGLTFPVDDETKLLKRDRRFAIDFDGVVPPDVYRLTNRKVYLDDYRYFGGGALTTITVSFDMFSKERDKLVALEDGSDVWICDYHERPLDEEDVEVERLDISAKINGRKDLLIGSTRTYSPTFTDNNGSKIEYVGHTWEVLCDFIEDIDIKLNNDGLKLTVTNRALARKKFKLQLIVNEIVYDEIEITIDDVF
jgi:hypothetical protein